MSEKTQDHLADEPYSSFRNAVGVGFSLCGVFLLGAAIALPMEALSFLRLIMAWLGLLMLFIGAIDLRVEMMRAQRNQTRAMLRQLFQERFPADDDERQPRHGR